MKSLSLVLLAAVGLTVGSLAASAQEEPPEQTEKSESAAPGSPDDNTEAADDRTRLNLLGEISAEGGEGRRNENVRLTLIDNNVLKEINRRMGTTPTVTTEFGIEQGYFGKEFGGRPPPSVHLVPQRVSPFHGDVFWTHNNSVFSARSFFQVGDVQPARTNDYGVNLGLPLWEGAFLTFNGSQRALRGQVNGNVLVPAADERTPLTADPAARAIVEAVLGAYPDRLPNRTDINPRALNTNAPQNIDNDRVGGVLDQVLGVKDRLSFRYSFTLQNVEAFQLVGGQNPDTTTRNHLARITWSRTWTPATTADLSAGFDRIGSLLVPEETSLGPYYVFSLELDSICTRRTSPIDRAQNMFRYGGRLRHIRGDHALTFGFNILRRQVNGFESSRHRGMFSFRQDFDRDTVENLLMGTPSSYTLGLGNVHRGFRDWSMGFYAGDDWRVSSNLTLNLGLRYEPVTRPHEVTGLSELPYTSDVNNFAPRFGFAYRLPGSWGRLRAAYGLHYGEIFPATYLQARFNPPGNISVRAQAPDLADPLKDFDESDLDPNARTSIVQFAPDLTTPYSHLYNFSWEFDLAGDVTLELGYVGSRSHRLLTAWTLNRARVVPGIEQTTKTVSERRPDQRYFDVRHVHNGSRGYFDAAKIRLNVPLRKGFSLDASYWFSKAIDLGADYTGTASGIDAYISSGPSEFNHQEEVRGLSRFDQSHATLWRLTYETPQLAGRNRWLRGWFGGWQITSVALFKSGAPFSIRSGSDAPGYGNVDGSFGDNPILLDPSVLGRSIDHPDTSLERLQQSAFTTIEPTEPRGNLGRNVFRKDGIANINMGLSKRWSISGDRAVLLRAESLNVFNHPQFAEPGESLSARNFAVITNTLNDGRTFRLTLQFYF